MANFEATFLRASDLVLEFKNIFRKASIYEVRRMLYPLDRDGNERPELWHKFNIHVAPRLHENNSELDLATVRHMLSSVMVALRGEPGTIQLECTIALGLICGVDALERIRSFVFHGARTLILHENEEPRYAVVFWWKMTELMLALHRWFELSTEENWDDFQHLDW